MDHFLNHLYQVNVSKCRGYFPERDAARIVREMLKIISLWQTWELFDDGVQPEVCGIPRN